MALTVDTLTDGQTLPTALTGQSLKVSNIVLAARVGNQCKDSVQPSPMLDSLVRLGLSALMSTSTTTSHFGNYQQKCVLCICKSWW